VAVAMACRKLQAQGLITKSPLKKFVAAVSVGIVNGEPVLDLNYVEDKDAAVDLNVIMTDDGQFVEVQGAGEESTFTHEQFMAMLELGKKGVADLLAGQQQVLA
jgi:ribonuclease PH